MTDEREFHPRAICPRCGWHTYAPFGEVFHVHRSCCPSCSFRKYSFLEMIRSINPDAQDWDILTMRWIPTWNFWHPSTWGSGYWVVLKLLPSGRTLLVRWDEFKDEHLKERHDEQRRRREMHRSRYGH